MPKEKRSVRGSRCLTRACSGDMEATVPRAAPGLVRFSWLASTVASEASTWGSAPLSMDCLAKPKSRTLACPRLVMKILAGLMFRGKGPFPVGANTGAPDLHANVKLGVDVPRLVQTKG